MPPGACASLERTRGSPRSGQPTTTAVSDRKGTRVTFVAPPSFDVARNVSKLSRGVLTLSDTRMHYVTMFDGLPFILHVTTDLGKFVNRVLGDDGQRPIKFEHLDRWLAVLARVEERRLKEAG
jgi:hypothetical protein